MQIYRKTQNCLLILLVTLTGPSMLITRDHTEFVLVSHMGNRKLITRKIKKKKESF